MQGQPLLIDEKRSVLVHTRPGQVFGHWGRPCRQYSSASKVSAWFNTAQKASTIHSSLYTFSSSDILLCRDEYQYSIVKWGFLLHLIHVSVKDISHLTRDFYDGISKFTEDKYSIVVYTVCLAEPN